MTNENYLSICGTCKNRKLTLKSGLLCGLTDAKPSFTETCPEYLQDNEERKQQIMKPFERTASETLWGLSIKPDTLKTQGLLIAAIGLGGTLLSTTVDITGLLSLSIGTLIVGVLAYRKSQQIEKALKQIEDEKLEENIKG